MSSQEMRDMVADLIKALVNAKTLYGLYSNKHKLTKEGIDSAYIMLKKALSEISEITIGVIGNEIAFDEEPYYDMSKEIHGFIESLNEIGVEKFSFLKGVHKGEFEKFITLLNIRSKDLQEGNNFNTLLKAENLKHIISGKIGVAEDSEGEMTDEELKAQAGESYSSGIDFLTKTLEDIGKNKPINTDTARQLVSGMISNMLKNKNLLLMLTSTKSHDESTFVHDMNVSVFTLLQAEALGLDENYLSDIGIAGLLHDVGKVAVSGDIIRKKGALDNRELQEISRHPANGAKALLDTEGISVLAAIGAFEHHMLYDLTGYPQKCFGKLNLVSMMIGIADYYDALRSNRSYRDDVAPEEVYEGMMKLSGEHFQPDLLNNFFSIIGVYPPGTLVELDTKAVGLVLKQSALDSKRPQVQLIYNSKGEKDPKPQVVNLLEKDKNGNFKRSIVKSLSSHDKPKMK
ncbi:HD-GYP domain-containing protein [Candidatus Omnitrophota bacterium]